MEVGRLSDERVAIQKNIEDLNCQIEKEELDAERKRSLFVQDLESQIQAKEQFNQSQEKKEQEAQLEKITYTDRDNELAAKLANWDALNYSPHFVTVIFPDYSLIFF